MAELFGTIATAAGLAAKAVSLSRSIARFVGEIEDADDNVNDLKQAVRLIETTLEMCDSFLDKDKDRTAAESRLLPQTKWYRDAEEYVKKCYKTLNAVNEYLKNYKGEQLRKRDKVTYLAWKAERVGKLKAQLQESQSEIQYHLTVYQLVTTREARRVDFLNQQEKAQSELKILQADFRVAAFAKKAAQTRLQEVERLNKLVKKRGGSPLVLGSSTVAIGSLENKQITGESSHAAADSDGPRLSGPSTEAQAKPTRMVNGVNDGGEAAELSADEADQTADVSGRLDSSEPENPRSTDVGIEPSAPADEGPEEEHQLATVEDVQSTDDSPRAADVKGPPASGLQHTATFFSTVTEEPTIDLMSDHSSLRPSESGSRPHAAQEAPVDTHAARTVPDVAEDRTEQVATVTDRPVLPRQESIVPPSRHHKPRYVVPPSRVDYPVSQYRQDAQAAQAAIPVRLGVVQDICDLREPPRSPTYSEQPIQVLEGWWLRRAEADAGLAHPSWIRTSRLPVPMTFEDLASIKDNYESGHRKIKDDLNSLTYYQQLQISRLLEERDQAVARADHFETVLAAIDRLPEGVYDKFAVQSIRVVFFRRFRIGCFTGLGSHHRKSDGPDATLSRPPFPDPPLNGTELPTMPRPDMADREPRTRSAHASDATSASSSYVDTRPLASQYAYPSMPLTSYDRPQGQSYVYEERFGGRWRHRGPQEPGHAGMVPHNAILPYRPYPPDPYAPHPLRQYHDQSMYPVVQDPRDYHDAPVPLFGDDLPPPPLDGMQMMALDGLEKKERRRRRRDEGKSRKGKKNEVVQVKDVRAKLGGWLIRPVDTRRDDGSEESSISDDDNDRKQPTSWLQSLAFTESADRRQQRDKPRRHRHHSRRDKVEEITEPRGLFGARPYQGYVPADPPPGQYYREDYPQHMTAGPSVPPVTYINPIVTERSVSLPKPPLIRFSDDKEAAGKTGKHNFLQSPRGSLDSLQIDRLLYGSSSSAIPRPLLTPQELDFSEDPGIVEIMKQYGNSPVKNPEAPTTKAGKARQKSVD